MLIPGMGLYVCRYKNEQKVNDFLLNINGEPACITNYTARRSRIPVTAKSKKAVGERVEQKSEPVTLSHGPTAITAPVSVSDLMDQLISLDIWLQLKVSLDFKQGKIIWKLRQPEKSQPEKKSLVSR